MGKEAPKGAMSSPFTGFSETMGMTGQFGTVNTDQASIEPYSDEEIDGLVEAMAKIGTPKAKNDRNLIVEINGMTLRITKA